MAKKIMVVDDSKVAQLQLQRILSDSPYEVISCCQNGEDAVEQYRVLKPDLITMDILMPGLDGLEAARKILEEDPDAKILMISSLAYDETMGDWRTHGGIDIAAEEGRKVLAAGEGQVAEVYDDAMMGTTVTILQPDGVTAVYSNLAQKTAVAVGDLVDTGAVLGEVGRTALAESGLEPHLHLELLADGEPVNPLAYLPKLN